VLTNKKREDMNTVVNWADFLYVAKTPEASTKDHEPPLPMMPFGIITYSFARQPFSKQLYNFTYSAVPLHVDTSIGKITFYTIRRLESCCILVEWKPSHLHCGYSAHISSTFEFNSAPSCDHFGRHGEWKKYLATKILAKVANWRLTDLKRNLLKKLSKIPDKFNQ